MEEAATALAMHADEGADAAAVAERLDALAIRVRQARGSTSRRSTITHLHHVLFEVDRFEGNQLDYYEPSNSYLPHVLTTRRGIPISLALVYKAVAERLDLEVTGIGAPGHFLVRIEDEGGQLLVDPFHRGRILTPTDAYRLMENALGAPVPQALTLLAPVGPTEWLARMLRNLEAIHTKRAQPRDAAAMVELRLALERAQNQH